VQVLNKGSEKSAPAAVQTTEAAPTAVQPKPRGDVAFGVTKKIKTGCGNLYVIINADEKGRPFEIFTQIGKAGGCVASQCEAMGRMTSLALRSGVQPEQIVAQMRSISCHRPVGYGSDKVLSCSDAMAQALDWYLRFSQAATKELDASPHAGESAGVTSTLMDAVIGRKRINPADVEMRNDTLHFTLADVMQRGACPDCGGTVEHSDGCVVCRGCGYTECG
jgi:ribonucleoside-diphosphate reductase alpha chain